MHTIVPAGVCNECDRYPLGVFPYMGHYLITPL